MKDKILRNNTILSIEKKLRQAYLYINHAKSSKMTCNMSSDIKYEYNVNSKAMSDMDDKTTHIYSVLDNMITETVLTTSKESKVCCWRHHKSIAWYRHIVGHCRRALHEAQQFVPRVACEQRGGNDSGATVHHETGRHHMSQTLRQAVKLPLRTEARCVRIKYMARCIVIVMMQQYTQLTVTAQSKTYTSVKALVFKIITLLGIYYRVLTY